MTTYSLIGDQHFGERTDSSILAQNIAYWLDISFLQNGQFNSISLNELDYLGNDLSQLKRVDDESWPSGHVFQSKFKNWVYESGLTLRAGVSDPTICSGIWISDDFHLKSQASGILSYHIDFSNGRIIFDTADGPDLAYGSGNVPIYAEFSYKNIYFVASPNEKQNAVISQYLSNSTYSSGVEYPTSTQVPFPVVSIYERRKSWTPKEIGGHKIANHSMVCHVYADNGTDRDALCDILSQQENKKVPSVDWSTCESPLDEYNDINSDFSGVYDAKTAYPWKDIYIIEAEDSRQYPEIPEGIITYTIDIDSYI